jgi:hypothetical protein
MAGGTMTKVAEYRGADATTAEWAAFGVGPDLPIAGSGTAVTPDVGSPLQGDNDDAIRIAGGKHFQATSSASLDLDEEDVWLEVVIRPTFTNKIEIAKWATGGVDGYYFRFHSSKVFRYVTLGGGASATVASAVKTTSSWYHVIAAIDESGNGQMYVNGLASGAAVDVSSVGSQSNAEKFTVGAASNNLVQSFSDIAYIVMYTCSACLDQATAANLAHERFMRLSGTWPDINSATTTLPTASTRSTIATLDNAGTYHSVGQDWLRVNGSGLLVEPDATNKFLQSEDFSTSWTTTRSTVSDAECEMPGGTVGQGLIGTAVENTHYFVQTVTPDAGQNVFSVFASPGNLDWVQLWNLSSVEHVYFDVSSCTVGTQTGSPDFAAAVVVGSACRVSMGHTVGAAPDSMAILAAEADGDNSYTGDAATADVCLWGAQIEMNDDATSYVPTTVSAVTRQSDVFQWKADDGLVANTKVGAIATTYTSGDYVIISTDRHLWKIHDASDAANDFIETFFDTTGFVVDGEAAGVNEISITGSTVDVVDGGEHTVIANWKNGISANLFLDASSDGVDGTVNDVPDDIDVFSVGTDNTGEKGCGCLISEMRVHSAQVDE